MAAEECPLPEVAAALSPFIKSRDEVTSIRRNLQNHLQAELRDNETKLSSISLTSPGVRVTNPPAGSLTGVRKAYWKALLSHTQAQEKYEALRAELDSIKHSKNATTASESSTGNSSNDGYMTLLRQREKYRKLKVIDRALSNIDPSDGGSSTKDLDDLVKAKSGETPMPPSNQPSLKRNPEVDAKLMELKKAIVSTKRRAEEQRARVSSPSMDGVDRPSPQSEVAGFQKALQVLTVWMEDQLTLIASAEADTQSASEEPTTNGVYDESQVSMTDIERLYEQYLEARQQLIDTVNDDEEAEANGSKFSFDMETSGARGLDSRASTKSSAEILLPFMPALIAVKQEEQALVQQSSHNRRQMAVSEDEMANLIRRFAGESHLVQPSATQGKDWVTAAAEAGATAGKFINDRLVAGEQAAERAKDTMSAIQSLPEALRGVAG
jgi:hypothetical protein